MGGVAQPARDGSHCLTIANASVPSGTPVLLVSTHEPQRVDTARVETAPSEPCSEEGDEKGHALIEVAAFYNLRLAPGAEPSGLEFAVVAPAAPPSVRDNVVVGDLDAAMA